MIYDILQQFYTYLSTNWNNIFSGYSPPKLVFPMHTIYDTSSTLAYVIPEFYKPDYQSEICDLVVFINIYSKTKNVYECAKIFDYINTWLTTHAICGQNYSIRMDNIELTFIYSEGSVDLNINGLFQIGVIKLYIKIFKRSL